MVNDVYKNYYKENGFEKLLINKIAILSKIKISILISLEIIICLCSCIIVGKYKLVMIIGFSIAISISFILLMNRYIKKIMKQEYNIESIELIANFEMFNKYREKKLKEFLEKNVSDTNKNICYEAIYERINDEIQECKSPSIISGAIITAILGPLWIQFLSALFQKYTNSAEELIIYFIMILIIALYFIFLYWIISINLKDIIKQKYFRWKQLNKVIKNIEFYERNREISSIIMRVD